MQENTTWILGGITAVVSTLCTCIVFLFNRWESTVKTKFEMLEARADECDEDRQRLRERITFLEQKTMQRNSHD